MLEKVEKYIESYHMLKRNDKVVVGVSGGADSVCLLLCLQELKDQYGISLTVVHVHHGIRGIEADRDAEYVEALCKEYGIPFFLFREDIPALAKAQGLSEEEAGRKYRYQCFYQVMEQVGANKLATAHHMGDQAETVLFHLIRGTDLAGMTGISPVNGKIIRPLLNCRKEELTDWLIGRNVTWQEDVTNTDDRYTRNRLRNQVIPVLESMNGQAVRHIADFAERIAEHEKFFQKLVREYLDQYVILNGNETDEKKKNGVQCRTDRIYLKKQERILSEAVIYQMITFVCKEKKDISREHVDAVYQLLSKQSGKKVMLPYQTEAEISYESLIIRKCFDKKEQISWSRSFSIKELRERNGLLTMKLPDDGNLTIRILDVWDMDKTVWEKMRNSVLNSKNNYTKLFACDTIKDTLYVRMPDEKDYFVINDKGNTKKLSRYFIDAKVPAKERSQKLLVANGHEVLWVIGGRRCETYKIKDNTRYVLLLMYEGEEK